MKGQRRLDRVIRDLEGIVLELQRERKKLLDGAAVDHEATKQIIARIEAILFEEPK